MMVEAASTTASGCCCWHPRSTTGHPQRVPDRHHYPYSSVVQATPGRRQGLGATGRPPGSTEFAAIVALDCSPQCPCCAEDGQGEGGWQRGH